MIVLELLYWLSLLAILHTYVIYPLLLELLGRNKINKRLSYINNDELPFIHVFIAAYNEEAVLSEKLESLAANDYPAQLFRVWIGSDNSDDLTDFIVKEFAARDERFKLVRLEKRSGKTGVLNKLFQEVKSFHSPESSGPARPRLYVLTDANVIFKNNTLTELAKFFRDPRVGLVGAMVRNTQTQAEGISIQEKSYIQRENRIKFLEGELWGTMMGAFGSCYAIRPELIPELPPKYLMEDYYISMNVLARGHQAMVNPEAICYEDVSNRIREEFKRKVRISAGNFQNLAAYFRLLWPPWKAVAFSFFSHKVLRWLGPFFLIIILVCGALLAARNEFYLVLFIIQCAVLAVPLVDLLLKKLNIHIHLLRFISYFYAMNVALLLGFFKYLKGIKSNVWQPTERNR